MIVQRSTVDVPPLKAIKKSQSDAKSFKSCTKTKKKSSASSTAPQEGTRDTPRSPPPTKAPRAPPPHVVSPPQQQPMYCYHQYSHLPQHHMHQQSHNPYMPYYPASYGVPPPMYHHVPPPQQHHLSVYPRHTHHSYHWSEPTPSPAPAENRVTRTYAAPHTTDHSAATNMVGEGNENVRPYYYRDYYHADEEQHEEPGPISSLHYSRYTYDYLKSGRHEESPYHSFKTPQVSLDEEEEDKEVEKVDNQRESNSCESSRNSQRKVQFDTQVVCVEIPNRCSYSPETRKLLWTDRRRILKEARRNSVEYAFESYNWREAIEEDGFCDIYNQKVHPAHVRSASFAPPRTSNGTRRRSRTTAPSTIQTKAPVAVVEG